MRVVSNTSPISNLAIIGRLDLLRTRYGRVLIPPAVARELTVLSHPEAKARISAALTEGWLLIQAPPATASSVAPSLDPGETEAIALALSTGADVLLMDEKRGREAARRHGLTVAGVLGELLRARQVGLLPVLRSEINRLRSEAGFSWTARLRHSSCHRPANRERAWQGLADLHGLYSQYEQRRIVRSRSTPRKDPMSEKARTIPGIDVLNTGYGDFELRFDENKPDEVQKAKETITDMLKRGYAIFVHQGKETHRVRRFDPDKNVYIIGSTPAEEIPVMEAKATAVGRSAGG